MTRPTTTRFELWLSLPAQRWVGTALGAFLGGTLAMLTAQPVHLRPSLLGRARIRLPSILRSHTANSGLGEESLMSLPPAPDSPDGAREAPGCPPDMVEVNGSYCPAVEQICTDFISEQRDRCGEFRPTVRCVGAPTQKTFCIDRYEYPNRIGILPTLGVTWEDAGKLCAAEGRRLCTDSEWTLACEGNEMRPYPYGFKRDSRACNIDKPYIVPDEAAYADPARRAAEAKRLNQSEPSGSRSACVSPFGAYDLTGNVDEWVFNEHGSARSAPYVSGLKGGYWGPVRNRCRPMTVDHNQWHFGYQIGFRCCADPVAVGSTPNAEPQRLQAMVGVPGVSPATAAAKTAAPRPVEPRRGSSDS
ncbi:MAG: SUMF1/EgtB/PvdO family nonheme iron enzyme [Polyangiaceae bacterium]|nr:SUMF1/EgtB/PvdO family nonheme iron enzyme [Polyangiaceae bacterium]